MACQWLCKDGLLRHPTDSEAWKSFDSKYIEFLSEPRNLRLGLAADGFNLYGNMSNTHSKWAIFLIPYNLPPWMCMKKSFFHAIIIDSWTNLTWERYRRVLTTPSRRTEGVMGFWSKNI